MQEHKLKYKNHAQSDHNFIIHRIPANTSYSKHKILEGKQNQNLLPTARNFFQKNNQKERNKKIFLLFSFCERKKKNQKKPNREPNKRKKEPNKNNKEKFQKKN